MKNVVVSAIALGALAGSALAQSQFGSVQFRWRERGLGVVSGPIDVPASATGFSGTALNQTTNPTVTTDARFVFVLEAFVTRASGNTDLGGLFGAAFNINSSDTRAQGQFAGTQVGATTEFRNAASASAATGGVTLPVGATDLPGGATGARGVYGPFRSIADIGSVNTAAIGVQNLGAGTNASLNNIALGASIDPLLFVDPDTGDNGPYNRQFQFYGLNNWTPVYTFVYNIADVATVRDITISTVLSGVQPGDSGLRGFRVDSTNNQILTGSGINSWPIDNGGGLNALTLRIIPTPGAAAILGLGGLIAARRRRA